MQKGVMSRHETRRIRIMVQIRERRARRRSLEGRRNREKQGRRGMSAEGLSGKPVSSVHGIIFL